MERDWLGAPGETPEMTPKQQYDARKAERAKLKDLEYQAKQATETVMMMDMVDRFATALERIADAMERR